MNRRTTQPAPPPALLPVAAGGEVGLQAAIDDPSLVRAVQVRQHGWQARQHACACFCASYRWDLMLLRQLPLRWQVVPLLPCVQQLGPPSATERSQPGCSCLLPPHQQSQAAPLPLSHLQLFDISLRCQHEAKQAAWQRPFMAAAQRLLHETPLGLWYFAHLANRQASPLAALTGRLRLGGAGRCTVCMSPRKLLLSCLLCICSAELL